MKFVVTTDKSINDMMRIIGYRPVYHQNSGEVSIVRQTGRNDYPRFHVYIKENNGSYSFNLHLDQKKPSYAGSTGHSGDYDGPAVEGEAERIKQLMETKKP